MKQITEAIKQLIEISDTELEEWLLQCREKKIARHELVSRPGRIPGEIFFINKGLIRVTITGNDGNEQTLHFALENKFIADYSAFILKQPSLYTLQAVEETEVVVLPRTAVEWGYNNLKQGDRLGRLIAESYFIYQDNRLKNMYASTPKERYDTLSEVFPDIHNRVPQHMIASYLGITPVHLSRLKNNNRKKI
jgi:hypothetical protein